jgi:7-cyano-7-deazaguanine synthase
MQKRAVILISGGLDSATCLASATQQGYSCYALSFNYHQRHHVELIAAKKVAQTYNVQVHKIIDLDLSQFGGSALTDLSIAVPDYTGNHQIPVTYVPARNTIFLSIALGWAEVLNAHDIFIGVSAVDYSEYPDCRPDYIAAYQRMAELATKAGVEGQRTTIHTPLIHLSKAETIKLGLKLGLDYSMTITCYRPNDAGEACGRCDSCTLRREGFRAAGVPDPTLYFKTTTTII